MEPNAFIPFHRPSIGLEEIDEVIETLGSGWITTGPRTHQFEHEFAAYVGAPYAIAVNSATAGLHLALVALGIKAGDEVITTPNTFCSTVTTILHTGATPILADIGNDGNIDPASIAERITSKTRAIIPVHIAGLPCRMREIWQLARRHNLFVIEDAAHAAGARYRNLPIGSMSGENHSDACVFSFYATKNLTTGEGGMITCSDPLLADRMKVLSLHGISKDAWQRYGEHGNWYYEVTAPGFKYNLSDLQSAIGIHQLHKLDSFIETRTQYAHYYNLEFSVMPELEVPPDAAGTRHAWHLYILRLRLESLAINRDQFITELRAQGVGVSVHFIPIPLHPYFAVLPSIRAHTYPRALTHYSRIVSIPLYPAMTESQLAAVVDAVKSVVHKNRCRSGVTRIVNAAACQEA
ncbi:MAG: DegT/DnrJ/EryC1/StrS family aminotransferase [Bryobacteraceae bacterium]